MKMSRDVVCISFIENLGGARMYSNRAGANPCGQVESQWQPWRLAFALRMWKVEKHSTGNQACMDLMTVARQPGQEKQQAPMNHDILPQTLAEQPRQHLLPE